MGKDGKVDRMLEQDSIQEQDGMEQINKWNEADK